MIESLAAFYEAAPRWDDLWRRSCVSVPTARAALVAHWLEHFAANASFRAYIVEQDGRFLAALPLVEKRIGRVIKAAALPGNEWSPGAQLLLDPAAHSAAVLTLLVSALQQSPWPLLWLEGASCDAPHWQALMQMLQWSGCEHHYHEQFRVARVELDGDWDAFQANWSGNHRRHMRKALKRAEPEKLTLRIVNAGSPDAIAAAVREGFAVEDRSWKRAAGTSVMRSPGMLEFFLRQSELLAELGHLHLVMLDDTEGAIAFEYGWSAKGVYYTPKVGYDEAYAQLTPSQILRYKLFEQFHQTRTHRQVDFFGPLSDATSKWQTSDYSVGRLVVSTKQLKSLPLMWAYRTARPRLKAARQWLRDRRAKPNIKPPAPPTATTPSKLAGISQPAAEATDCDCEAQAAS